MKYSGLCTSSEQDKYWNYAMGGFNKSATEDIELGRRMDMNYSISSQMIKNSTCCEQRKHGKALLNSRIIRGLRASINTFSHFCALLIAALAVLPSLVLFYHPFYCWTDLIKFPHSIPLYFLFHWCNRCHIYFRWSFHGQFQLAHFKFKKLKEKKES